LITQVLEAARLVPSGTNAQPWKFIGLSVMPWPSGDRWR
jgi:nitroreductase